ncbi:MAG: 16S rRNA (guanine(966)-N(2))-methyltransferase RsmD [Hyphomicrobiales bacterium]|nr:16S rRNA (guanine(966)-N(2))-methyltransferase RsmD [Hyphomicrobiales bacterium]
MRIVAGKFKGHKLAAPKDSTVRPTSDRVREALFNILEHGIEGFAIDGARVLDLFAGTGALGLEALSRGAKYALFIDDSTHARSLIRRNIEALHLTGVAKIWRRSATKPGPAGNVEPFDLVFLDPPYGKGFGEEALTAVQEGGWIAAGGIAVLEEAATTEITVPDGYEMLDERTYGDTQISIFRADQGVYS